MSDEGKEIRRKSQLGRKYKIITCPHCNKIGGASAMRQWHFNHCKKIILNINK